MTQSRSTADQHQAILQEYRHQAPRWGSQEIDEHLRWVVGRLPLTPQAEVIDVASGTGLFARAVASTVATVTAVDITPEMIQQGRRRAQLDGISNIMWREAAAEELPFAAETFDLAITRYFIHHVVDPTEVLKEMARVCRTNGVVVVVDMVSSEDPEVAAPHDGLERLMDQTHTSVLSPSRLVRVAAESGLTLCEYLSRDVPMNFDGWQAQVPRDSPARLSVRRALEAELDGGAITGMRPFRRDGALWFTHVWGVLMARKTR